MTYKAAIWSAIIGNGRKFGLRITTTKRDRYMKLIKYWRDTQ